MNNKQIAILVGAVLLVALVMNLSKGSDICFGFDGKPCDFKNHKDMNKSR